MATERDEAVLQSLVDLLAAAKLWMPDLLYEIDPRIHRARQLVATLGQVSDHRPPSIVPMSDEMPMLDLSPPPTMEDVERIRGPEPPWDVTAGLDAFMASDIAPADRTEGAIFIIRDWLIAHGFLEAPPESEQAN